MLDVNFIRDHQNELKEVASLRGLSIEWDKLFELSEEVKNLRTQIDQVNRKANLAQEQRDDVEGRKLKFERSKLESNLRDIEEEYRKLAYQVPNLPLLGVPKGDESHAEVLHKVGEPTKFEYQPKDHIELGETLDIIDIPTAAKVSGARFAYLKNEGVMLELALVQFAMGVLQKNGFTPVIPPALIKYETTEKLGYWHGKADKEHTSNENYYLVEDYEEGAAGTPKSNKLYLIGTGEHALVPMNEDKILAYEDLPIKYAAYSPCFRREVGTGGKDVRGILRVHQFDKVEMVEFVIPEDDETERTNMLKIAETLLQGLGLPYQVKKLPTGDMGFPAAETIDIETWIPSQGIYRETHSISTTTDFQARRLKTRYRKKDNTTELVHILNGTVLAIGRTIIAILENYQQEDGSVKIPEVLIPYTGFSEIRPK